MRKLAKTFLLVAAFAVSAFAYNSYTCSLQNLVKPGSCKPSKVWNPEYRCWALPNIRVHGEPVCVD